MSYDAPLGSPERLYLEPNIVGRYNPETEQVEVTATFTYQTWCCDGAHEVSDAIACLISVVDDASQSAWDNRVADINREISEALASERRAKDNDVPQFDWVTKDRIKRRESSQ